MTLIHIIWKGKGWQVALVTFVSSLMAEIITRSITNDENLYQSNPYPLSISLVVSGIITYFIYLRLKKENDSKILINIEEAKRSKNNSLDFTNSKLPKITHKIKDSLFFIPIKYWSWILLIFSIINIIHGNLK